MKLVPQNQNGTAISNQQCNGIPELFFLACMIQCLTYKGGYLSPPSGESMQHAEKVSD